MSFGAFMYSMSRTKLMEYKKLKIFLGLYIKFHLDVVLTLEKHFGTEVAIGS